MVEKILDNLFGYIEAFRKEGWQSPARDVLIRKMVEAVEKELGVGTGEAKKALALKLCDEIYGMVKIDMGWLYRWVPRWIVKRVYMWACSKAIELAVKELNDAGVFKHS